MNLNTRRSLAQSTAQKAMPITNQNNGYDRNDDLTNRLLCALATPLRRRIVNSLMHEPGSAKTLSDEYGMPLGNVSYHLSKVLYERCRVVEIVARYSRRGAQEKVYGLRHTAFVGVVEWPAIPASIRSGIHGVTMSSFLTAAIASMEAEADDSEVPSIFSMQSVAVDRDGQQEIATAVEDLRTTVKSVAARCAAISPADLRQTVVGSATFEAAPGLAEENA
jgi:DNA-binding transcriptional ArsR family regulator